MENRSPQTYYEAEYQIKNMNTTCCFRLARKLFESFGAEVLKISAGYAKLSFSGEPDEDALDQLLRENGMALLHDPEYRILEKIKAAVIELIHHMNNVNSVAQKSDYLVEKLRMSYRKISSIFRKYEPVTLERFIILHKIERVKDLIDSEEFSLSEIAYMMDYNSVQYLSSLFKKEVGVSVSEYKKNPAKYKKSWDDLY